jgi:hypothetical protein
MNIKNTVMIHKITMDRYLAHTLSPIKENNNFKILKKLLFLTVGLHWDNYLLGLYILLTFKRKFSDMLYIY